MGYKIPKDATVIANVWYVYLSFLVLRRFSEHSIISAIVHRAVMHDPELYPDPCTFSPDRFTASDTSRQLDPRQFAFGFGKRACPGIHLLLYLLGLLVAQWDIRNSLRRDDDVGSHGGYPVPV